MFAPRCTAQQAHVILNCLLFTHHAFSTRLTLSRHSSPTFLLSPARTTFGSRSRLKGSANSCGSFSTPRAPVFVSAPSRDHTWSSGPPSKGSDSAFSTEASLAFRHWPVLNQWAFGLASTPFGRV